MRFFMTLLPLAFVPYAAFAQKPSEGKVLLHVSAAEAGVYKGLQQRTPDLEESAKDIRLHLNKGDWTQSTEKLEEADIRIVVLGRREDPDKGIAIGYTLDAGAYKTEDEVFDVSEEGTVLGGASPEARSGSADNARKSKATYEDLANQFARSLDAFCQQNYQRIVVQRKK